MLGLPPNMAPIAPPVLVELWRGSLVESRHRGHLAAVSTQGDLLSAVGDPHYVTYMRSAAKPFQALAIVHSGAYKELDLSPRELAVACASHNAEGEHLEAVASILRKAGLKEDYLDCGCHAPFHSDTLAAMIREGCPPDSLHHNCSGKHAGMLAVCCVAGWPLEGYTDPEHPLQSYLLDIISIWMDIPLAEIVLGVDGCGAPVVGLPVSTMAGGWARLAAGVSPLLEWSEPAQLVRSAMKAHPFLVGGTGRICSALNDDRTPFLAKGGAEGVYCMGSLEDGWGLAVKIEDGGGRASGVAALRAALDLPARRAEVPGHLEVWLKAPVRNTRGQEVGHIRPVQPWPVKAVGRSVGA